MGLYDDLRTEYNNLLNYGGMPVRLRYYNALNDDNSYDDAHRLNQSGSDIWTSGIAFPVSQKRGSSEALLIEQGKILQSDKKLFLPGTIVTDGIIKIGIGSPVTNEHSLVTDGIISYPPLGPIVYKKAFIRVLPTGSFTGEM